MEESGRTGSRIRDMLILAYRSISSQRTHSHLSCRLLSPLARGTGLEDRVELLVLQAVNGDMQRRADLTLLFAQYFARETVYLTSGCWVDDALVRCLPRAMAPSGDEDGLCATRWIGLRPAYACRT